MKKNGRVLCLDGHSSVIAAAAVVGKTENEGPLGGGFDYAYPDDGMNQCTWEQAEIEMHRNAVNTVMNKAGINSGQVDIHFAGDLLNQCSATTFGVKDMNIPLAGLFGACSTMALSLALAGVFTDSGAADTAIASTSSHFCSAEKQFRFPLEYGGQRTPTNQRTATASGAAVVKNSSEGKVKISAVMFGRIRDYGIADPNNMGAAMAPVSVKLRPYPICQRRYASTTLYKNKNAKEARK